ncbi:transposase-like protein [Paraburkholderia youngii]
MDEPPSRSKDNGNICIAPSTSKTTRLIFFCALVVTKLRRAVTFRRPLTGTASPETFTVDKSGAKLAALEAVNAERETPIRSRKNKHRNNVVEQNHRPIERIIRSMMCFKDFRCARIILSGIEVMHMIRKGKMKNDGDDLTAATPSIR